MESLKIQKNWMWTKLFFFGPTHAQSQMQPVSRQKFASESCRKSLLCVENSVGFFNCKFANWQLCYDNLHDNRPPSTHTKKKFEKIG